MLKVEITPKKRVDGFYSGIRGKKVIIWGISARAARECNTIMIYGGDVIGFTDSYQVDKTDKKFCGQPIFSLKELTEKKDNIEFVIATRQFKFIIEIVKKMEELGIMQPYVRGYHRICTPLELSKMQELVSQNRVKIQNVYARLADEQSRKVFEKRLEYLLTGNQQCMVEIFSENTEQYFPTDIVRLDKKEVFIDAGACCGESSEVFIKLTDAHYKSIHLFEPSERIVNVAQEIFNLEAYKNVYFYKYGLYNENKKIGFIDEDIIGSSSVSEEDTCNSIEVVTLDSIFNNSMEKPTFIKMDIEGAEKEAIHGAQQTILEGAPKLAICVYHEMEDLWEIPTMIMNIRDDYKIYLRHHSMENTETVCYAIPDSPPSKIIKDILTD